MSGWFERRRVLLRAENGRADGHAVVIGVSSEVWCTGAARSTTAGGVVCAVAEDAIVPPVGDVVLVALDGGGWLLGQAGGSAGGELVVHPALPR